MDIQYWLLIVAILAVIVAVITLMVIIIQRNKPKPIVTVDDEEGVLYYKNIGIASAINIQTWENTLNLFSIIFPKVNLLEPKEKREVIPRVSGRTQLTEHFVKTFDGLEIGKFPYFKGRPLVLTYNSL